MVGQNEIIDENLEHGCLSKEGQSNQDHISSRRRRSSRVLVRVRESYRIRVELKIVEPENKKPKLALTYSMSSFFCNLKKVSISSFSYTFTT